MSRRGCRAMPAYFRYGVVGSDRARVQIVLLAILLCWRIIEEVANGDSHHWVTIAVTDLCLDVSGAGDADLQQHEDAQSKAQACFEGHRDVGDSNDVLDGCGQRRDMTRVDEV